MTRSPVASRVATWSSSLAQLLASNVLPGGVHGHVYLMEPVSHNFYNTSASQAWWVSSPSPLLDADYNLQSVQRNFSFFVQCFILALLTRSFPEVTQIRGRITGPPPPSPLVCTCYSALTPLTRTRCFVALLIFRSFASTNWRKQTYSSSVSSMGSFIVVWLRTNDRPHDTCTASALPLVRWGIIEPTINSVEYSDAYRNRHRHWMCDAYLCVAWLVTTELALSRAMHWHGYCRYGTGYRSVKTPD